MDNVPEKIKPIVRSNTTAIAFQLDGLCAGLELVVQTGQTIGAATRSLFDSVMKLVREDGKGKIFEVFTVTPSDASLGDLLVVAHTARETYLAFLTPEELAEQQMAAPFGLAGMRRTPR